MLMLMPSQLDPHAKAFGKALVERDPDGITAAKQAWEEAFPKTVRNKKNCQNLHNMIFVYIQTNELDALKGKTRTDAMLMHHNSIKGLLGQPKLSLA